jgi:squalene-associated FAD-dependent desaturase
MMSATTHIFGAGLAGLSAALALSRNGQNVVLYDAAPQAGGRCRTIAAADGFSHDNGTHVLFSANRTAMDFLRTVGARDRWVEPEPEGLPLHDAGTGRTRRVGLSPWSWRDPDLRPEGLTLGDIRRMMRLAFSQDDRPVASVIGNVPILHTLIEPLTLAVLNTPVSTASSRRLGKAMRCLLAPGSTRLLVARNGLSDDLVEPAIATLRKRGADIRTGQRLRTLRTRGDRVAAFSAGDSATMLGAQDRMVLALPPWEVARLLPHLPVPDNFEPIVNVHFRSPGLPRPRFIGLVGTLAQWVMVRRDHVSVTVSAADDCLNRSSEEIARQIWSEIRPLLCRIGVDATQVVPDFRVVKEKRATIRQSVGVLPQPILRPFSNLVLAGDWIGDFPATIESAVLAGERAAHLLYRAPLRRAPQTDIAGARIGHAG